MGQLLRLRTVVFLMVLLSLLFVTAGCSEKVQDTKDTISVERLAFDDIHMLDEETGWALDLGQVFRTADGGANWLDVTPPGLAGIFLLQV